MLEAAYLSSTVQLIVMGVLLAYCVYHEYLVSKVIAKHQLQLRSLERLMLFKVPFVVGTTNIPGVASLEARRVAWPYFLVILASVVFYGIGPLVTHA